MPINPFLFVVRFAFVVGISTSLFSCVEENTNGDNLGFDRTVMLEHYADNIILPNIKDLQQELIQLEEATLAFTSASITANLTAIQEQWKTTMIAYQHVSAFNFGPSETFLGTLTQRLATFPVDTGTLEGYIDAADVSLDNLNMDTRGLLAMEYMIFDKEGNIGTIMGRYDNSLESTNRKNYLNAICGEMRQIADELHAEWLIYRDQFVSNNGTQAGSSISELFNNFSSNYESIKNFKVGLPLGKRPGQTQPEPHLTEAYYSGTSVEMIKANFESILNLYYGRTKNGASPTSIGFDDYLKSVTGGEQLFADTEAQVSRVLTALNVFHDFEHLSDLIIYNQDEVEELFIELQKLTKFFKSDMASLLGISITYNSGDGD